MGGFFVAINMLKEIENQELISNPEQEDFPLARQWINQLREPISLRDRISFLLSSDRVDEVVRMGFPADLLDIMKLWKEKGPQILTSFSHPQEAELYKLVGLLNLKRFQDVASLQGITFDQVTVNYYDTVSPKLSVRKPLSLLDLGTGLNFFDVDMFGFQGANLPVSQVKKDATRQIPETINNLVDQFRPLVIEPIVKKDLPNGQVKAQRRALEERMTTLFGQRFNDLLGCFPASDSLSQSEILMEFERNFSALIFDEYGLPLEDVFGYDFSLFSKNEQFLALVRETLSILMEKRGVSLFKTIINPGEGLVLISNVTRRMLTKTSWDSFALTGGFGEDKDISDEDAKTIILEKGIPLAKLEMLAIIAGGFTLHMGSEYGARARILEALEIPQGSQAERYLSSLRIGQDKEAGNECVKSDTGNALPIVMGYALLGKEGIRRLLDRVVGKTTERLKLDRKGLKRFFVSELALAMQAGEDI